MSDQPPAAIDDRPTGHVQVPLDREAVAHHARRLGALADPTRVQLVSLFAQDAGPLSVDEIAAALGIGRSAASAHLAALTEVGLVTTARRGDRVCFRINEAYARCLPTIAEAIPDLPPRISRPPS